MDRFRHGRRRSDNRPRKDPLATLQKVEGYTEVGARIAGNLRTIVLEFAAIAGLIVSPTWLPSLAEFVSTLG